MSDTDQVFRPRRDDDWEALQVSCSTCRGFGYVGSGHVVQACPECLEAGLMESARGLRDSPPCYGYASCCEECMGLCPWAEGCRGVSR